MNHFLDILEKKLGAYPIGVWVPYYETDLSAEWLEKIKACGINFVPTLTCNGSELDLVREAGLKCLVNDDRVVYSDVSTILKVRDILPEYIDRAEVLGMFVWDEPSPLMMRICGVVNAEIQRVAPNAFGYINLHPSYSDPLLQREGLTYEQYLEHFVSVASPKLLSFDHYPFLKDKITEDYFYNLQAIRDCCDRHDLEFWSFLQTCKFLQNVTPTPEQLAWHANTNIAYGAKGLLYFTYATVKHDPFPKFGAAMMDGNGQPTARYFAAKKINEKISKIGKTLLGCKHCGVRFFNAEGKSTASESFAKLRGVSGGAALAGCLTRGTEEFLYLVNLSQTETVTFTLCFEPGNHRTAVLGAGEGELLKV